MKKSIVALVVLAALAVGSVFAEPSRKWEFGNPDTDQQLFWERVNAFRLNPEVELDRVWASSTWTEHFTAGQKAAILADVALNDRWYPGWRSPVAYFENAEASAVLMKAFAPVVAGKGSESAFESGARYYVYADATNGSTAEEYAEFLLLENNRIITNVQLGNLKWLTVFSGKDSSNVYRPVYGVADASAKDWVWEAKPSLVGCAWEDRNGNGRYDLGEGLSGVRITPSVGDYYTETAEGGGYVIEFPQKVGKFSVTASGGGLPAPVTKEVTIGLNNVKLDFLHTPAISSKGIAAGAAATDIGVTNFQPEHAGVYIKGSDRAIYGVRSPDGTGGTKIVGAGQEVLSNVTLPTTGYTYDQISLRGNAVSVTADHSAFDAARGQITRVSFVDLSDDIVQVEFSGPGTLTIVLDNATGMAAPVNYNQPGMTYMKGHARIVLVGANEFTHLSVFSVGTITALNQSLFKPGVQYDGVADIASIAILSKDGRFGGLRAANAHFSATQGVTGIYAPNVKFTGPVFVGDISAYDSSAPVFMVGACSDARLTGGDLQQPNGKAVEVNGLVKLKFTDGTTSHGNKLAAQAIKGRLERSGVDVTATMTAN